MRILTCICLLGGVAFATAGCEATDPGTEIDPTDQTTTLMLEGNSDGDLSYCDADGECYILPNPDDCSVLTVEVDLTTGETCEVCTDSAGSDGAETCTDTQIACVLVTAPEPDCVVCAHVGGAVIHSTCVVEEPTDCEVFGDPVGGTCQICYNAAGDVILDECPDCSHIACPDVECPLGFVGITEPGECCEICLPEPDCNEVPCPDDDYLFADCPEGTMLVRDPSDCCSYVCEPTECPDVTGSWDGIPCDAGIECPNGECSPDGFCLGSEPTDCPPGYEPDFSFPNCGACVQVNDDRWCESDADCGADEFCALDDCYFTEDCGCYDECDATGECYTWCSDCACSGVCLPSDPGSCPEYPPVDCLGDLLFPGFDDAGCPLPPVCVCDDGIITSTGACEDPCAFVDCAAVIIDCEPGSHLEFDFPFCCGVCVPDDCTTACSDTACGPDHTCEVGPDCGAICVPAERYCAGDYECASGEICSVVLGDCMADPDCFDDSGASTCPAVCFGVCLPEPEPYCTSDSACPPGHFCELPPCDCGDPAAGTSDPDCFCPGICVADPTGSCTSDFDCAEGFVCAVDFGVCDTDPAGGTEFCYGTCIPAAPECDGAWRDWNGLCRGPADDVLPEECCFGLCEPVTCDLWCEFGFKRDSAGCEYCECAGADECLPVLCDLYCPFGFQVDASGCEFCSCNTLVCEPDSGAGTEACPPGFVCADDPTCDTTTGDPCPGICIDDSTVPCEPVTCTLACPYGFTTNSYGCEICECYEIPCGGFMGLLCPDGSQCVDDSSDTCDPDAGGADCMGSCQPL